jgi:hypothetical protein
VSVPISSSIHTGISVIPGCRTKRENSSREGLIIGPEPGLLCVLIFKKKASTRDTGRPEKSAGYVFIRSTVFDFPCEIPPHPVKKPSGRQISLPPPAPDGKREQERRGNAMHGNLIRFKLKSSDRITGE